MNGTIFLIFSGLIAFVPGTGDEAGSITAFLVKEGGHSPELSVPYKLVDKCPGSCTSDGVFCECKLDGAVVLDPLPEKAARSLREVPQAVLPKASTVNDDGWLIHMKNVDPDFAEVDSSRIGAAAAARIAFGWDEAATCAFDDDDDKGLVYAVKFIGHGSVTHEQAVAELIVFRAGIRSEILSIELSTGDYLKVRCDGGGCPILITNEVLKPMPCDECSDCASGGHFGEYLRLTGGGVGSVRAFRQCGKNSKPGKSGAEICKYARDYTPVPAVSNRVICPMVVLEP